MKHKSRKSAPAVFMERLVEKKAQKKEKECHYVSSIYPAAPTDYMTPKLNWDCMKLQAN
jgi:hypothetical protein